MGMPNGEYDMKNDGLATKVSLLLVSSLTVMAGTVIAPALPSIQLHFSEIEYSGLWIQLVLTLPALFIVLAAPLTGWFLDRSGRLRLLIPAMLLYGIAGSSGLYLNTIGAILAGRALLGVAVAGIMTSATTLIADYYEGRARSQFMGWQAAFMNFGGVIFLTAGGSLAELGWRWPFAIYLFAIALVPLVVLSLNEPVTVDRKSNRNDSLVDARGPVRLIALIYGAAFSGMLIFYFIPLQIPFYLNEMVGAGPAASGMSIAVVTLFATVSSFVYGRVKNHMGFLTIFGLTFGLMGAGYLFIGLGNGYSTVLTGLAVSGLGTGLLFPNLNVWLTLEVPAIIRGRAIGGLTTAIFMGQFVAPLASQTLSGAFGTGFLFVSAGALLLVLGLVFAFLRKAILAFMKPVSAGIQAAPVKDDDSLAADQREGF
jgi:MFS family permease